MTTYLSNADLNFFRKGLFGVAPALVSAEPMFRKQGNGNWTGFVRKTYADGSVENHEFIMNAKTRDDVQAAYLEFGART